MTFVWIYSKERNTINLPIFNESVFSRTMHDTEKENNSAIIDFFLCLALLFRLYGYITNYTRNIPHVNLVGLQPIYLPHLLLLSHISPSVPPPLPLPPVPSSSFLLYQLTLTDCDLGLSPLPSMLSFLSRSPVRVLIRLSPSHPLI